MRNGFTSSMAELWKSIHDHAVIPPIQWGNMMSKSNRLNTMQYDNKPFCRGRWVWVIWLCTLMNWVFWGKYAYSLCCWELDEKIDITFISVNSMWSLSERREMSWPTKSNYQHLTSPFFNLNNNVSFYFMVYVPDCKFKVILFFFLLKWHL